MAEAKGAQMYQLWKPQPCGCGWIKGEVVVIQSQ
jgi:hypothetical protein